MSNTSVKTTKRNTRRIRIRAKVKGNGDRPRLAVFKSNKYIYAQIIDDMSGKTLVSSEAKKVQAKTKTEQAKEVGKDIAKKALEKNIKKVVFDRGGNLYAGRVKILATSARENGLEF